MKDRRGVFCRSASDEVSVISWNLLAQCYHTGNDPDWTTIRLPTLIRTLKQHASCGFLCFQEVDIAHALDHISNELQALGFTAVVQQRRGFQVVNAIFFKTSRMHLTWVDHRSRVLLMTCLLDDQEIGIANVHLQAGEESEETRISQLTSALHRLHQRNPSYSVVCGDFNSCLSADSKLRELLSSYNLFSAPGVGPTHTSGLVLDHVWAGSSLEVRAVVGSAPAVLDAALAEGFPSAEHPSDHLPVGSLFHLKGSTLCMSSVEFGVPSAICKTTLHEWLEILRSAPLHGSKREIKEHRRLEAVFLKTVGDEVGTSLCEWRSSAHEAAKIICQTASRRALCKALGARECRADGEELFDPGGASILRNKWAGC